MTLQNIDERIGFLTGTSYAEYPAANRLINLNKWYNTVHSWILQAQDEWDFDDSNQTDFPTLTTNLIASQQDYGGLGSENMIKVQRVEVSYDGANWQRALPFEKNEDDYATDTTTISGDFSTTNPRYRMLGNSILLYPIPTINVTDGLKVFIDRSVIEFTNLTDEKSPGFDIEFHDLLPLGTAYEYNSAKKNDKSLMQDILLMKKDLQDHYSYKLTDRKYALTPNIEGYD